MTTNIGKYLIQSRCINFGKRHYSVIQNNTLYNNWVFEFLLHKANIRDCVERTVSTIGVQNKTKQSLILGKSVPTIGVQKNKAELYF
jgi:hypothetical protein